MAAPVAMERDHAHGLVAATRRPSKGPGEVHRRIVLVIFALALGLHAAAGPLPRGTAPLLLAAGVIAGLPHGALDYRAAGSLLRPKVGQWWPLCYVASYLAMAGSVVWLWTLTPVISLAAFLLLSVLHFGLSDTRSGGQMTAPSVLAHGGAAIVVPSLSHPQRIAEIFVWIAGVNSLAILDALRGPLALLWIGCILLACFSAVRSTMARRQLAEIALVIAAFIFLPPILAFALYFGILHSPRALLGEASQMPGSSASALRQLAHAAALPALGAAGFLLAAFFLQAGEPLEVAALRTMFIGLAALTVPHMTQGGLIQLLTRRKQKRLPEQGRFATDVLVEKR